MVFYNFFKVVINIDIYQHFRREEYELIGQLTDKYDQVEQHYTSVLTHFLDPRGQYVLEVIYDSYKGLNVSFYGRPDAEKERAIISPGYYEPKESDFDLTLVEIDYPKRFVTLKHQHILGALMSLGIEHEQVGDIIVSERIQFVLTSRLGSFIMLELQRARGASAKLYTIPVTDMIQSNENWEVESATVDSLRLDIVIKGMIRKSRMVTKQLIEKKRVKANHTIVDSVGFQLQVNDLISTQGFGRAHITGLGGKAKKDKTHITHRILFEQ